MYVWIYTPQHTCGRQRRVCVLILFPPRNETQTSFGDNCLYPLSHLASPRTLILKSPLRLCSFSEVWCLCPSMWGCIYVCMVAYMHVDACERGSRSSSPGIVTQRPSTLFFWDKVSRWPRVHLPKLEWLASRPQWSSYPVLGSQRDASTVGFLHGPPKWNLGHYVCVASTY